MLQWSRMVSAQTAAGRTTSLTNNAVSLVARHSPVAAERVRTSRVTRMTALTWSAHSVSAKPSPGEKTSTRRASSREWRFLSAVSVAIERRGGLAQRRDGVMQDGLVCLDLGDQMNAACGSLLERFF